MVKKRTVPALAVLLLATWSRFAADSPSKPDAAYIQSFEKWKAAETEDLKANWLPLVGLFWLKRGVNAFGSDPSNAIVFSKGPAHAGEFDLDGKDVTLKLLPETQALIHGKRVTTAKLEPDRSQHQTEVELGTLRFHVIVRGQRVGIRVKDTDSEYARKFKGMEFFPLNMDYCVTAKWLPGDGKKTVQVPNVLGDVMAEPAPGTAVFTLHGQEFTLTALGGDPSKGLFFVFNDATAKSDTYPGGRFLDTGPVSNGTRATGFQSRL